MRTMVIKTRHITLTLLVFILITAIASSSKFLNQDKELYDFYTVNEEKVTINTPVFEREDQEQFTVHYDGDIWEYKRLEVKNRNIETGAISQEKLQSNVVTSSKIKNGEVKSLNLDNQCVTSSKLSNSCVETKHIQDNSIDRSKLKSDSVVGGKISPSSVETRHLADFSVTRDILENDSVSGSKMSKSSISTNKLKDNSITSSKLDVGSVSSRSIQDRSISSSKLKNDIINSSKLDSNSVESKHLQNDSVASSQLKPGSVNSDHLSSLSIETEKLKHESVTSPKIALESIQFDHFSDSLLDSLYVCEIRECDECETKLNQTIDQYPGLEEYLIQSCSSHDECAQVETSGGFYEWSGDGCGKIDGEDDPNCGCCIQTPLGINSIPPEAPSNIAYDSATKEISWRPSFLGLPSVDQYTIVCTQVYEPHTDTKFQVDPQSHSKKLSLDKTNYECKIVAENGVGEPVTSETVTVRNGMYLASNGVTVICSEFDNGFTSEVKGKTYKKRNLDQIKTLINNYEYSELETTCTSGVSDMSSLFTYRSSFNADISSWDTSSVTSMGSLFYFCKEFNQDLSNWDTSQVTTMSSMFSSASKFNHNISNWDTSQVKAMGSMFSEASSFNQYIGNWDVSNVRRISYMFQYTDEFNQDIGDWDTGQITDMKATFRGASRFNQDLSGWDVSQVDSCSEFDKDTSWKDSWKPDIPCL
eukprot:gb/GECH01013330.1/.p1 GENE.gb/GECH01013330.1/~~gb/GECH01013330.1/.p1  ORF type:complete len:702 (+),score=132.08 gb/GECH01013330.1/:1-2106(+)